MPESSNEKKNEILNLLQSASEDSIRKTCRTFYSGLESHWYDQTQFYGSLYPLLGEKSPNKPIMLISDTPDLSDELKKMNEKMKSYGCCDKSIIYIRNSGCHFTVLYLFQKEKKILFINPMGATGKPDLKNEGYTLRVSNTEIQKDGYSCGPIASEIARMLYSNHEVVENYLSNPVSNCDPVSLDGFLPREELNQLRKSFSEEITIDYSKSQVKLKGADYRTAHLMCNLTANESYFYVLMSPMLFTWEGPIVKEIPQAEKQKVEKIRSFFIDNPDNVKLFNREVNKLLWPNKVVDSDIKVPTIKKDTTGKSETVPNNVKQQQIKPSVDTTNGLGSSGFSSQPEYGDIQDNSQQSSITPKSSQKNKLPVIAAFTLAIAGIVSGVAIAVYLEMLAVGIAVGACCLVAAAIIYCCSGPSNSLENISAKTVADKCI
ncbi:TomO hydrophobic C-terminal domain-containing protein [Wolbachia endosymbiont of Oedothorax gibbosus]|uniref:TomO hydrophobic C-terminal domain-containing protein n=1 Tax=Wolbachia endosymbiont of Oedothorax gibbosus TaxID=931100 RepID=UPI002023E4EA|nr:hypothetical protein [Wolbachia endosymbiont of Oedothorax gibbosus]